MNNTIIPQMKNILSNELLPDEQIIWCQQPDPMAQAKKPIFEFILGILVLGLFALGLSAEGNHFKPFTYEHIVKYLFFFVIFGIAGVCSALSPITSYVTAIKTVYVITNRRAILIEATKTRIVQSFAGDLLINIKRESDKEGNGHIIFYEQTTEGSKGRTHFHDVGFFDIKDTKRVETLLMDLHQRTCLVLVKV